MKAAICFITAVVVLIAATTRWPLAAPREQCPPHQGWYAAEQVCAPQNALVPAREKGQ